MNVIDHRILVPASPDRVWHYISDISRNPNWQVDCRSVSFLTTMHTGPGTRWRSTDARGRDRVIEVTVWYDRLGYEYKFVDGVPFGENKGQFRLQEIAEGTIVQWTFNYETTGFIGGLMNSLSLRRSVEKNMVESLRTLWRVIKNTREAENYDNKSLMRDAPDAEARAQYRQRHPGGDEKTAASNLPRAAFVIPEPPVKDDDTRPGAAVKVERAPQNEEPDFLSREAAYQTQQMAKVEPDAPFKPPAPMAAPAQQDDEDVFAPLPTPPSIILPGEEPKSTPTAKSLDLEGDTSRLSIFDLFGVPKPSETQETRSVALTQPSIPTVQQAPVSSASGRIGLRVKMRQKLIKVRRP